MYGRRYTSAVFVVLLISTALGWGRSAIVAADTQEAPADLPLGYHFVVPPTKITPDRGAFPDAEGKPFFRETSLAVNRQGLVTVFTEAAPGSGNGPTWSCRSSDASDWECQPIDDGPPFVTQVDPWIADTTGDPCPRYANALTLTESRDQATVTFTSTDQGRTWEGPHVVAAPTYDDDGQKILFNGRTFVAWRHFNGGGEFVSRLGTDDDPCDWTPPVATQATVGLGDGDHPRLAATREPGVLAIRGAALATTAGGHLLRFNQVNADMTVSPRDVPMATTFGPSLVQTNCATIGECTTTTDAGATLIYDPGQDRYLNVFTDRAVGDEGVPSDLVTRYQYSDDGGLTWSTPEAVAGSGAPGSQVGASSTQPNLAYDPVLGTAVLDYYEKPTRDSDIVELRLRVMEPDGSWAPPVTLDSTAYLPAPSAPVSALAGFGDYTALQACGGLAHISYQKLGPGPTDAVPGLAAGPTELTGYIAYTAVRFATTPTGRDAEEARRECPRVKSPAGKSRGQASVGRSGLAAEQGFPQEALPATGALTGGVLVAAVLMFVSLLARRASLARAATARGADPHGHDSNQPHGLRGWYKG
ncbi:MAG: glycoside hydrolase [Actinobacteria bacterium]|nr:glycoside hydrolase [Actinomycetota bacterium]